MRPRILVFDLETRFGPDHPAVHGWDGLRCGEGGISALAVWDSVEQWTYVYDDHNVEAAASHIEAGDVVVGYRSLGFDVPCIEGLLDRKLRLREHVDLLETIWTAIGERDPLERQRGYKLNEVAHRCLGRAKLFVGSHAPTLAVQGRWADLFRYCMDDVRLTRDLLVYIIDNGGIIDANGGFLPLSLPACLTSDNLRGPS
jgi:DEAD/DEAH box helicase domain-containing protein